MKVRRGFGLRLALIADLIVYTIALMLFALLPLFPTEFGRRLEGNNVTAMEWSLFLLGFPVLTLLVGRLFSRPHIPFSQYAYLATAGYGLLVLAGFWFVAGNVVSVEPTFYPVVTAWALIGITGSIGAHIWDGGPNAQWVKLEGWFRERDKLED